MSPNAIQVRADICEACPTPCERQRDAAFHATPCAACPASPPRWNQYGECPDDAIVPPPPATSAPMRGLGDLVAKVADPIAKMVNLDKSKCGCDKRREALNKWMPFRR